jgi:hypothetical protein
VARQARRPYRKRLWLLPLLVLGAALIGAELLSLGSGTGRHIVGRNPASAGLVASQSSRGDCAAAPSRCGFRDGTNSGVPAGTVLESVPGQVSSGPGWHWDPRGWVEVDGNGAVFSGYSTTANVDVTGSNAIIENSRIVISGDGFGVSLRHTSNVIIRNNTISAPDGGADRLLVGVKNIYGDESGTQVLGNDISRVSTGVQIASGVIQDNYIHDMGYKTGDHTNGMTSNGGSSMLMIRHNTVFNRHAQTDAISFFEDFGVEANRVIDNNLVAGGGYTIYGGQNPGGQTSHDVRITNNRFSRLYFPKSGYYGPLTAFNPGAPGNAWSGNVWDDTDQPVVGEDVSATDGSG